MKLSFPSNCLIATLQSLADTSFYDAQMKNNILCNFISFSYTTNTSIRQVMLEPWHLQQGLETFLIEFGLGHLRCFAPFSFRKAAGNLTRPGLCRTTAREHNKSIHLNTKHAILFFFSLLPKKSTEIHRVPIECSILLLQNVFNLFCV